MAESYHKYFNGKIAVVTGGSRGIGREICMALAKLGCKVYALARSVEKLKELEQQAPNGLVKAIVADLQKWKDTQVALDAAIPQDEPINFLVNNAATASFATFAELTEAELDEQFNMNVKAVINVTQILLPRLSLAASKGPGECCIINMSSVASVSVPLDTIGFAYFGAKCAMDMLTRNMAVELGPLKIRVNSINPGVVESEMGSWVHSSKEVETGYLSFVPLKTIPTIPQIVDAVLFFLSDQSPITTGVHLPVDGGLTLRN